MNIVFKIKVDELMRSSDMGTFFAVHINLRARNAWLVKYAFNILISDHLGLMCNKDRKSVV